MHFSCNNRIINSVVQLLRNFPRMYSASQLSKLAKQLFAGGPAHIRWLQSHRPYICPFEELVVRVPIGSRALDIGCGSGLFLGLLMGLGRIRSGYGFDISAFSISAARLMARSSVFQDTDSSSLTFERLGATDPWIQEQFDVVALIDVMHHVPPESQRQLLKLAAEHMKPGGLFLYKDMVNRPLWRAAANRLHDLILARQLIHYAPIANIEAWAADFGLVLIEGQSINRLWYGHELRVFRNPAQQL